MAADKIGGAPLLAVVCVGVILFIFSSGNDGNGESDAAAKSRTNPASTHTSLATAEPRQQIDLQRPVMTASHAVICNQDLLVTAAVSRAAGGRLDKVHDAFTSIVNRGEKVREAGCEQWRAGVRLYNAHAMRAPFDDFIGFGVTPEGMAEYFTMKSQLMNVPSEPSGSSTPTEALTGPARADSTQAAILVEGVGNARQLD
jgi:hypothetical protein